MNVLQFSLRDDNPEPYFPEILTNRTMEDNDSESRCMSVARRRKKRAMSDPCVAMTPRAHRKESEEAWRVAIQRQLETELEQQVRQALEPAGHHRQAPRSSGSASDHSEPSISGSQEECVQLNARLHLDLADKEYLHAGQRWKIIQAKRRMRRLMMQNQPGYSQIPSSVDSQGNPVMTKGTTDIGLYGLSSACLDNEIPVKSYDYYAKIANKADRHFGALSSGEKHELFYAFTKSGFKESMMTGRMPDGSEMTHLGDGRYVDKIGLIRDKHGPFWPPDYGPLHPSPVHRRTAQPDPEPLSDMCEADGQQTVENQETTYISRWRGVQIVYDSEKTSKDHQPPVVNEGTCPSLMFESRFECGNLRQARRVGQFEYELVLKTDLYTARHTQWYYFRVRNAQPGVTYKFKIVNLLKRDSLYNYGMRPLLYSDTNSELRNVGWFRSGHHVSYARNTTNLQCPLMQRERAYYMLEWQMEFPHDDDTCYLSHCYPYTFTDLKDDLDTLLADPERAKVMKREVLCETRAGNSCFLITATNYDTEENNHRKRGVVVSARVHPGETNSSWMMKGFLEYITSSTPIAKELRNKFVFKIIPMLNPDGVIVGNYRCSLAARDLNRNYRHPRRENFPTVWHVKAMMENFGRSHSIMLYCDLHGHSRKHNVFMYGCNSGQPVFEASKTESFVQERLFPWLMAQKSPDKFWFRGCKFQVRRSKESTGRVVMFKQLKISNSFTMEATFCGTTIARGERRHFNTIDFQDMGRVLSEVLLDYHHVQLNNQRKAEVVVDLTQAITHQVLESRGLLPTNIPDTATEAGRHSLLEYSNSGKLSKSEDVSEALLNYVKKQQKNKSEEETSAGEDQWRVPNDVTQLLDSVSSQSIAGCMNLLDRLNIVEEAESDSSDSDSESDPELVYQEPKSVRRKKKKHKKGKGDGRDSQEHRDRKLDRHSADNSKSPSGPLPAIGSADADGKKKKQISGGKDKSKFPKTYPAFVNKYTSRSNGGIPCFSEERQNERAAKRLEEMRKRVETEGRFHIEEVEDEVIGGTPGVAAHLHRARTQPDLMRRHSLQSLHQGSAGPIRTAYMHGAGNRDGFPSNRHRLDNISSDGESDDQDCLPQRVPHTISSSPYQNMPTTNAVMSGMNYRGTMLPHRRLPPMYNKMVAMSTDSCAMTPRHSHMQVIPVSRLTQSADVSLPDPSRLLSCRGRTYSKDDKMDGGELLARPQSPPVLACDYTDLLMQRLKAQKTEQSEDAQHSSPQAQRKHSERHSTCE